MNGFITWWWLTFVPTWLLWVLVAIVGAYVIAIVANRLARAEV